MAPGRRRALAAIAALPGLLAVSLRAAAAKGGLAQRPIPSTGELLPVVGVGTWQTFDVGGDAQARAALGEVLSLLVSAGGKVIDSSPMYGSSESVAGDLAAELGLTGKLFVATKVWTRGREDGERQMEISFRRLRVKRMDLMQVHNLMDVAVHTRTLADWKAKGRVRYVGITHSSSSAYAEVERALDAHRYDFLQINYSLGEREAERRLLPLAAERGAAVIVNRPFAEGALFRRTQGKPLPAWAAESGIASWAQYFLKWILGHPAVTCVIPGTGRPAHMRDNLAAGMGALPGEAQRRRMREYFDSL